MRLTSLPIINFCDINDFQTGSQWTIRGTDPNTLYFQLFDLDNITTNPYAPLNSGFFNAAIQSSPQRYIAGVGSSNQPFSMSVTFPSLDPTQVLTYQATPDPNDASVWSITLPGYTSAGVAPASGNAMFSLTQGTKVVSWTSQNILAVEMSNQGSC